MATLQDLKRRIEVVRGKERATVLATGSARAVVVLIGSVLLFLLLDYFFQLPFYGRWAAVLAALAALGWTVHKHLVRELRKILDDDEIALRVEARNPELRGRLISTIQLARTQAAGAYVGSLELLQALEEDTLKFTAPLDFLKIVNREAMVKFLAAAAVVLVIKVVCLIRFPDYFSALAMRLVDPARQFPTKTHIKEVLTPEFVARGDDLKVKVLVEGEIPEENGALSFRSEKDGTEITVDLVPEGRGVFIGILAKALDDMTAIARVGDGTSLPKAIKVLPRPEVKEGQVLYHPPKYTGLPDPPAEKFGGLLALQGSQAEISIVATKPLASAQMERFDGQVLPLVQTDAEGLEWKLKAPFPLDKSTSFHISLKDRVGLTNSQPPVEYPVNAKPDLPPTVKIKRPSKDCTVTPRAKPPITFEVRDDFGVRVVWLLFKVRRENQGENAGELTRVKLPLELKEADRRTPPELKFTWELESLVLKVGDQVEFYLEADDDCDTNNQAPTRKLTRRGEGELAQEAADPKEPYYPRSGDVKFTVISKEDKALEIQAEIARLFEQLQNTKGLQEEVKRKTRDAIELLQKELEKLKAAN